MSAAVAIRVSNFHGQHDYQRAETVAHAGFQLILCMAVAISIPIFLCRNSIGALFTSSAEVVNLVSLTIIPFIIYQFGDGMQSNYANALRGLSHVRPLMVVAFVAFYVMGIWLRGGLVGIWSSFPVGLTTAGLLYWWSFRRAIRKAKSLT